MIVEVHTVTHTAGQSVTNAEGTDPDTGDAVFFGGDWRPMQILAEIVEAEGPVLAEIEDWQITRITPAASVTTEGA